LVYDAGFKYGNCAYSFVFFGIDILRMALQSTGPISLLDIQNVFGGTNPIGMNEYYGVASGVPASGLISLQTFYGKSAPGSGLPNALAFSWINMPGGSRTLLNYITSFGVTNSSQNTGSGIWLSAYATITFAANEITNNNYFTRSGRVRVIDGDGSSDGPDWAIFNFDVANGSGDFDGRSNDYAFFGGENTASGGSGGLGEVTTGTIWGWNNARWILLYALPLGSDQGGYSHQNTNWWTSGNTVNSGLGKYAAYDNTVVSRLGFAVSNGIPTVGAQSAIFSNISGNVGTAKTTIESAGFTLFATPTTGAMAESIVNTASISTTGQFVYNKLSSAFRTTNKLYGAFLLDGTHRFTIEWTFTDSTNSMASFFSKTTSGGATYSFKVYNNSGAIIYDGTGSRTWNFSNGMDYAGLASRLTPLSSDDGIWGASISGLLDGNSPGPGLNSNQGWGMQNYDGGDGSYAGLFINSTTITAGTPLAYIYF